MAHTLHHVAFHLAPNYKSAFAPGTRSVEHGIIRYGHAASADAVRLICFPHAGGGAATFFPWWQRLQPDVEVCAVLPPRRDVGRLETPESVGALADAFVTAVSCVADRPFALFGHSFGAAVAYELSVRLTNAGHVPLHLLVAARGAPNTVAPGPRLADLDDESFVAGLREKYDAIPAPILQDRDVLAFFLPQLRADVRLHEQYCAPCVPLPCPITLLTGSDDQTVREADLDAWAAFTRGRFDRHTLPGGHFFVRDARDETLAVIARTLRAEVAVHE